MPQKQFVTWLYSNDLLYVCCVLCDFVSVPLQTLLGPPGPCRPGPAWSSGHLDRTFYIANTQQGTHTQTHTHTEHKGQVSLEGLGWNRASQYNLGTAVSERNWVVGNLAGWGGMKTWHVWRESHWGCGSKVSLTPGLIGWVISDQIYPKKCAC